MNYTIYSCRSLFVIPVFIIMLMSSCKKDNLESNDSIKLNTQNEAGLFFPPYGNWSLAHLSQKRSSLAATASNDNIFFAGGRDDAVYFNRVDIYDASTNIW